MKLEFVGRGVRIDKRTRQYTEEKLQKAIDKVGNSATAMRKQLGKE